MKSKTITLWTLVIVLTSPFLISQTPTVVSDVEAYAVSSGSMSPEIPKGSLIYTKPVETPAKLSEGDVITYKSNQSEKLIAHRVIDARYQNQGFQFKTKGDANPDPDPYWIDYSQIQGKKTFSLPVLGYVVAGSQTPLIVILFTLIPATLLIRQELDKIVDNDETTLEGFLD